MRIGLVAFATDFSMGADALAVAAEERGFHSLLFTEHTHIPCSRETPGPGKDLAPEFSHTLDPFVSLGAAAAVTSRLQLGTGVCLVAQRHPITLAKLVASVDHLSNGRFLFGIGAGWNEEEMRNHGVDPARRWHFVRERVEAMQAIWSHEEAEYHGDTVDFDRLWSWPKPVRSPRPPILVGGAGHAALDRVLDYGDGWMPLYGAVKRTLGDDMAELRRRAEERGRAVPPVSVFWAPPDAAVLEGLAAVGVAKALLAVPTAPAAEVTAALDAWHGLVERFA